MRQSWDVPSVYLALYSAARYSTRGRWPMAGVAALFLVVVGEIVREILFAGDLPSGAPLARWFLFFYNVAVLFLPLILGFAVRSSHERQRQLGAQAVELKREREENARRAVLEERVRIARELHDVVAHHVSVMGIQAGAARRIVATRPEKVEEVLGMIESSSRDAVVELLRLLGFLRRADQTDERRRIDARQSGPSAQALPRRPLRSLVYLDEAGDHAERAVRP